MTPVAIILPVHNDATTLAACVRSVLLHTRHPQWRLMVVDDGSTDGGPQVLREFKGVQVIHQPRGGVASALNAGIAAAPGCDIVRLHADVVIETPDWLEKLATAAYGQPKAGVVGVRLVFPDGRIDSEGRSIVSGLGFHPQHRARRAYQPETAAGRLCEVDAVSGALAYYRREVIDRVGGFDPNYGMAWFDDDDFCIAARRLNYKVYVEPAVRAVHYARSHPPTFRASVAETGRLLEQITHQFKHVCERTQAEYWESKWGWHPYHPDVGEIRRLHGATEICWQIGERLRFRPGSARPTVDCCAVTYNAAALLERMLQSLARTSYPAEQLRVFIVNNGSTDTTAEVLARLQPTYPFPLEVINLAVNTGVAAGLNFALKAGRGELVARLDDDIILPPDWLEILLGDLQLRPFAGCVGTKTVNDDDRRAIQWGCPHSFPAGYNHRDEPDDGHADYLARVSTIHGCCNLYRRDAFERCGWIDLRYSPSQYDDIDHNVALIQAGYEVLYDGRVNVIHKINNGLDRSVAGVSNGAANAQKFFGKWGHDIFEVLETSLLLSREGRYIPTARGAVAEPPDGPAPGDFPRRATLEPAKRTVLQQAYDQLHNAVPKGSELHLFCDEYLAQAKALRETGYPREALDVVLTAVNFAPRRIEVYRELARSYRNLGLGQMAATAARRGLHLQPEDAAARELAQTTAAGVAELERETLRRRGEARRRFQELPAAEAQRRVLLLSPFEPQLPAEKAREIEEFAARMREAGILVQPTTDPCPDTRGFDLVHVWGMSQPHHTISQIKAVRQQSPGCPVVLSPFHRELGVTDSAVRTLVAELARNQARPAQGERLLAAFAAGRLLLDGEEHPLESAGGLFHRSQELFRRRILGLVDHLLLWSESERATVVAGGGGGRPVTVCPRGIDVASLAAANPETFVRKYGVRNFLLVAAPVNEVNNQVLLLHALRTESIPMVIVGRWASVNCLKLARKLAPRGTVFLEELSPEMMASAFRAARLFALPGWADAVAGEVISAAATECALVLGDHPAERELAGEAAHYCNPANPAAIRSAVKAALAVNPDDAQRRKQRCEAVRRRHDWSAATARIAAAYEDVIGRRTGRRETETLATVR
ncbi:MAG: glycosyltransferase [Verrucomicrobia bacterium]|nr:glycosyltransferase [Verrucomicrobiota bacterium]